jgi:LacI family transcriptional regulator
MGRPRRPGGSAPTVRDIAAAAGLSTATAARALGGYGAVSEQTRVRVEAAAERLGYRANGLARSMITGTTNTLALVIADIENPFFARACRGFTDTARAEGYEVIVANTDENVDAERTAVKVLLEKRIDGLAVAAASRVSFDHLEGARMSGVQVVLLDRHIPGLAVDSVLVDSRAAAATAVGHLIEQGHRRIGLVTGASPEEVARGGGRYGKHLMSTGKDRINGYRNALRHAGIEANPDYLKLGDFHREAAGLMARELRAAPVPPTAIFTTDAVITLGVLEALQTDGVALPDQVSLVGFDDPDWAVVVRPSLTVVAQPAYQLGALAARRVIARIRGDQSRPRRHLLPTSLVVRESVATPRLR